jgi:twitching motility protein PilI
MDDQPIDFALPEGVAMPPSRALAGRFDQPVAVAVATSSARHTEARQRQGFLIGPIGLMVRYEDGSELTELPPLYRLPHSQDWFLGIANLHGALVPVFDLAIYAGLDADPGAKRMLLVLAHGADAAGIVIHGMPQRLRWMPDDDADPDAAPGAFAPHVRAAALIGEQLWFELDCASLLDALERSVSPTH